LKSEAEAKIRAARAEAESALLAAARSKVLEAETQTVEEREPSPPPRPPPPTIVVEDEAVVRPVAPVFVFGLKVRSGRAKAGNPYRRERVSTVDLLIKIGCLVKKKNIVSI
jgi:hypothetical protein